MPRIGLVALVLFAALDVVLVLAALDHVRPATPAPGSAAAAPVPSEDATPADATSGSSAAARGGPAVPDGPLLLAQAEDGTLLRATRGDCTGDAEPQVAVSTDGGESFRSVRVAADLRAVLAVGADASDELSVVGADAECTARVYTGAAARRSWQAQRSDDRWHLTGSGDPSVHAPDGDVETPCVPADLSTINSVRLLCESGVVLGTADAGESWAALGRLTGATAIAFDGPSRGYALQARDNCAVAAMTTGDGGASWELTDCLDGENGRAVAAQGDVVTALVDDAVWRSDDGAQTWTKVG